MSLWSRFKNKIRGIPGALKKGGLVGVFTNVAAALLIGAGALAVATGAGAILGGVAIACGVAMVAATTGIIDPKSTMVKKHNARAQKDLATNRSGCLERELSQMRQAIERQATAEAQEEAQKDQTHTQTADSQSLFSKADTGSRSAATTATGNAEHVDGAYKSAAKGLEAATSELQQAIDKTPDQTEQSSISPQ